METLPLFSSRPRIRLAILLLSLAGVAAGGFAETLSAQEPPYQVKEIAGVEKIRLLPPGPGNPRNSEGDFIRLKDGRVLFIYTRFTGGGSDHAVADLASRVSADGGKTWSDEDVIVTRPDGPGNVMSVSLLRLADGRIALFYLRKQSLTDCRPVLRISTDEAETWSEPAVCIDSIGYYVLNNDRAVQLKSGRLVLPVSRHNTPEQDKFDGRGVISCYLSDDAGKTWRRSQTEQQGEGDATVLQEPGVIELTDGRLMMFCRTTHGSQYLSFSDDGGNTWSPFAASEIKSPVSPATIERIPETGDLLVAWNNHADVAPEYRGKRTPFHVALSHDEGKTWEKIRVLEDDPNGWYCYTAMTFVDDHVLLGHCAGDRRKGGLNVTQITRFPVSWLYQKN